MDRRHFFKRLGMIAGCAVIAPSISIERLKFANFEPGKISIIAIRSFSDEVPGSWLWHQHMCGALKIHKRKLEEWFEKQVPANFLNAEKIKYTDKLFDYDHTIGTAGRYKAPMRPIHG